jgi:hypothetical protein
MHEETPDRNREGREKNRAERGSVWLKYKKYAKQRYATPTPIWS